jgi:metallophosphoesterase superfamily enzyme
MNIFVIVTHFHPSLTFVSKAGAHLRGAYNRINYNQKLLLALFLKACTVKLFRTVKICTIANKKNVIVNHLHPSLTFVSKAGGHLRGSYYITQLIMTIILLMGPVQ